MPARKKVFPKYTVTAQEKWTWEMAEEALGHDVPTNRSLKIARIVEYSRLMEGDLWKRMTAGPVVFDWDGNIINGRHRLHAQVETKTTQFWDVVRGVPPEAIGYQDANIPRRAEDTLRNEGWTNTSLLASVARWCWLLDNDEAGNPKISVGNTDISQMLKDHPDIEHSMHIGQNNNTSSYVLIPPTAIGAAHWWIAQHNGHAEADMFFDRFRHINNEPDGSPILALANRFRSVAKKKERVKVNVQIAMIIKCWNYDVTGDLRQNLSLHTRSGEFRLQEVLQRDSSPNTEMLDEGPDAQAS